MALAETALVEVVFDLDGTLVDPMVGFRDSINRTLSEAGHPPRSVSELTNLIGPPLDDAFRTLLELDEDADVTGLVQTYRRHYDRSGWAKNTLYDGVADVLRALTGRGLCLGVCTSKRHDFAMRILEQHDLASEFDLVSGGDVGVPKTKQLTELVETGQVAPDAVMVGDRAVDVAAAHSCGLLAIGVTYGYGTFAELRAANADALAHDTSGIVPALEILTHHEPKRAPGRLTGQLSTGRVDVSKAAVRESRG